MVQEIISLPAGAMMCSELSSFVLAFKKARSKFESLLITLICNEAKGRERKGNTRIDPGTNVMGYGVLHVMGDKLSTPGLGVVQMKEPDYGLKLKIIFERTTKLIEEYQPDEFAVEAPFFGKNVQSMLKLGRAQGVAMAAALVKNIPIAEYSPRKIKQSITGNGAASKEQVAAMIKTLVNLEETPKFFGCN